MGHRDHSEHKASFQISTSVIFRLNCIPRTNMVSIVETKGNGPSSCRVFGNIKVVCHRPYQYLVPWLEGLFLTILG